MKGWIEKIKNIKNKEIVLAVLLGIVALLIVFAQFPSQDKEKKSISDFSPTEYATTLEKKLETVLNKIEGAGKTSVVVTVASGMESVPYQKEDGTILQSGGKVVILKENYPAVVGVVIVCEGAGSYATKMQVTGAACALLNVSEDRVRVYPKAS